MQPERGGRPRRGGGRPNRRRPSGREKPAESSGEDGHSRGGGGRGRRGARGGAAAASPSATRGCESATAELDLPEMGKEEPGSYSRRKVVSNWHRYEDSEKETQNGSGESQRGTDFSVLLSSAECVLLSEHGAEEIYSRNAQCRDILDGCDPDIRMSEYQKNLVSHSDPPDINRQYVNQTRRHGERFSRFCFRREPMHGIPEAVKLNNAAIFRRDSFTQFRFAEEKEWITENLCPKQVSGLYVDCQSLVQAFEELPLHLKLNVAAELVQDATPVTLPQIKLQSHDVPKKSGDPLEQQKRVVSHCYPMEDSAALLTLTNKDGCGISSEALQRSPSSLHQVADHLDEDLDLLLKLDAPINPENNVALEIVADGIASGDDLKMTLEETDHLEPDRTEETCSTSQPQEVTSNNITEEELEEWLDSMIS